MLNGKQKKFLRAMANRLPAVFQIGKEGLSDNLYKSLDEALKANELIKISVLKTCEQTMNEIEVEICAKCRCELVQQIGKTIVIYRRSKDNRIILP